MKNLKKYVKFIKESFEDEHENDEGFTLNQLYDLGSERIGDGANLLADYDTEQVKWDLYNNMDPSEMVDSLKKYKNTPGIVVDVTEIDNIIGGIEEVEKMINDFPSEDDWNGWNEDQDY